MTTTEKISNLHKKIALLELGLKSLENRNIPLDKKITYTKGYLNKKYLYYEKIQNLIELEKADISVAKRDVILYNKYVGIAKRISKGQYEVKFVLSNGIGSNELIQI